MHKRHPQEVFVSPHSIRVPWIKSHYEWLKQHMRQREDWAILTCQKDPDFVIYLFVHESDMVRFKLTWM